MCEPWVSDLARAAYVGETYLTERERDSDLINVRAWQLILVLTVIEYSAAVWHHLCGPSHIARPPQQCCSIVTAELLTMPTMIMGVL